MTEDKYKMECARQRGVIKAQEKQIEKLERELRLMREQRDAQTEDLRNSLKNFLLDGLR